MVESGRPHRTAPVARRPVTAASPLHSLRVNNLAAEHGHGHSCLPDLLRGDAHDVIGEHDEIRYFAGRERTFGLFLERGVRAFDGPAPKGLFARHTLIRKPAT